MKELRKFTAVFSSSTIEHLVRDASLAKMITCRSRVWSCGKVATNPNIPLPDHSIRSQDVCRGIGFMGSIYEGTGGGLMRLLAAILFTLCGLEAALAAEV